MNKQQWTKSDLLNLARSNWPSMAVQAAVKLDLFTEIDNLAKKNNSESVCLEDLAKNMACDFRGLEILASAMASMGFLTRCQNMVTLTEDSKNYLSCNSSQYMGYIFKHYNNVMTGWLKLDQAVKTGLPIPQNSSVEKYDEDSFGNFLMSMFHIAEDQVDTILNTINLDNKQHMLDLGGGPGAYAINFCKHYPNLQATIFDLPQSEKFALNMVSKYCLNDRVKFKGGNFITDPLPTGYDFVWISQIIHMESPANIELLLLKAVKSLNKGGSMIIQEFILSDDRQGPVDSALFGLNMLAYTEQGTAYTQSEIIAFMSKAGLSNVRRLNASLPKGCGLVIGELI